MKKCLPSGKSKDSSSFSICFKTNHSWPWTVPLRVSLHVPVAIGVGQLILHWGHTYAIMCNYGDLNQQMHKKSSLKIICTYRRRIYSGHVSDALEETRSILNDCWVSNKIKY